MVFNSRGVFENSVFAEIEGLLFNMNFETSYVSLVLVVAAKLEIYDSSGWFFYHGGAAANFFFIAIESLIHYEFQE